MYTETEINLRKYSHKMCKLLFLNFDSEFDGHVGLIALCLDICPLINESIIISKSYF